MIQSTGPASQHTPFCYGCDAANQLPVGPLKLSLNLKEELFMLLCMLKTAKSHQITLQSSSLHVSDSCQFDVPSGDPSAAAVAGADRRRQHHDLDPLLD